MTSGFTPASCETASSLQSHSCSIEQLSAFQWRVTLADFTFKEDGPFGASAHDNQRVDGERYPFGGNLLVDVAATDGAYTFTARDVTYTAVNGEAGVEYRSTNNVARTSLVPSGNVFGNILEHDRRGAAAYWQDLLDGAADDGTPDYTTLGWGGQWNGARVVSPTTIGVARAVALWTNTTNYAGTYTLCNIVDTASSAFTGEYMIETAAGVTGRVEVTTAAIGDPSTTDCGQIGGWTTINPAAADRTVYDYAGDASQVTAVRVTVNHPLGTAYQAVLDTGFQVRADAATGSDVWSFASMRQDGGPWISSDDGGTVATVGGRFGTTTGLRDFMRVALATPQVAKVADQGQAPALGTASFTLTGRLQGAPGTSGTLVVCHSVVGNVIVYQDAPGSHLTATYSRLLEPTWTESIAEATGSTR